MPEPITVYVAGALTGSIPTNVHLACKAGARLMRAGLSPFVPHLYTFMETVEPGPTYEEYFQAICLPFLARCDVVLRLPGESPGADREVAYAKGLGIQVFTSEIDLIRAVHGGKPVI